MRKFFYKYILIPIASIFWHIFKPKTFGVKAIILCDNEMLLVKNISESKWHLPGGGMHKNELSLDAIKREVKEELNFDLELFSKIKFCDCVLLGTYVSNYEGKQDTIYVYIFKLDSKPKFEIDKSELSDGCWFNINDLLNNKNIEISSATIKRLNEYLNGQECVGKVKTW